MAQNIDFSGSNQIQTPQYPDVHHPSQEMNEEVFQAKRDLMKSIQTFLEKFNCIPFEEKPQILFQAWEIFFAIQYSKPENPNELFQKLLEDLKELAEYEKSQSRDQAKYGRYDAREVKNVVEQPAERGNRNIQSLQNFRVVHKSSVSFRNTSQISSIHAVATILSTKEPEHSLSMGYEHLSITPEMEYDEVTDSNATNLLPIPSECEVTSEDKRDCKVPVSTIDVCDDHSDISSDSKDDDDILVYDDDFEDIEYVEASLSDPEIVSEEENVIHQAENDVNQEEEEVDLKDISQIQDIVLREKLLSITRLIANIESLNDNPTPDCVLNSFEFDNSLADTFLPEFETFYDHSEETRSEEADLFLASNNSIPPGTENFADDSEGDIRFLEELLIDDSIISHESSDSYFEENPSIPRPSPEPPDAEFDAGKEIPVVMNDKDKFDKDYYFFMFDRVFSFLSTESEDTIFDPENPNELFQKLLEDLKELAEYEKSQSRDRPIFLNDDSGQNKECFENSSDEIAVSNPNQEKEEPPQDSDIHQQIEECCVKVCEEQKQSMEDTMLELVKICQDKELLCLHDNVEDLIESALNSKLLSINSQRLEKEQQEVKNVVEQPAERENLTTILSTKEPEHSLSMGYEHLNITPETESDEVTDSNATNLLPIPSECEVTSEDKRDCEVPVSTIDVCYDHSDIFSDSKDDDDISVYDDDFKDIEYVEASLADPEIISEEENVIHQAENDVNQEEEEVDLEDISQIQDIVLREKLLSITRLIANIESLNDNPTPDYVLNSFEFDNSLADTFLPEFETFCNHSEETRSGNTTHADNSLPEYDSFCFEIEPDQERLINLVKNDIPDNSSNDPLLEEADLFLASNNSIPPGTENFADDSEGDIRFLEELLIDDSILSHESSDSYFEENPSIPRPPPEPPDVEFDAGKEIPIVMNDKDKFDKDNYFFMFDRVFSFLSTESEDTIFDPQLEHSLSMGYEHLSITLETESDEVTESNAKNPFPIPSECEVTSEDKRDCEVPVSTIDVCDDHSDIFSDSKDDDDISVYDDDFEDIEYVEASLPDPEIVSEEENVVHQAENDVNQEEEEVDLEDISQIQDIVIHEKLLSITRLITNIESLNDNPTPDCVLNSFKFDNSLADTFLPEFETFCDHSEETRSGNTTHADNSLPEYDSFFFEIEPDQERLINLVKNDIPDNSSNDTLLEEVDLFLAFNNSIPPGIEIFVDDSEGDIRFLKELLIDDFILSHESFDSYFEENLSIPRPPPEPPDVVFDAGKEIPVVMNDKDKFDKDYYFFMFERVFSFLSAESEDTIFDPHISV
nr:hypothetical protein [Tanacetum cinerariifolium]